nr:DNA helicase [uncultured Hyphomonas sp.]
MKLSVPLFRLERQAKFLSEQEGLPLHEALDRVAHGEGYQRWSQLAASHSQAIAAERILDQLCNGDIVLLCARREHGKTTLAFEIMSEAIRQGRRSAYFTLYEYEDDVEKRLEAVGIKPHETASLFTYDTSDDISASHIANKMSAFPPGALIVIDYLQILDQQRKKPALAEQLVTLSEFAASTGAIVIRISQINRTFAPRRGEYPSLDDVHFPNPVDVELFTKTCFLNDGEVRISSSA